MSDDDLTIARKLRSTYFGTLTFCLVALVLPGVWWFWFHVPASSPGKEIAFPLWLFAIALLLWMIFNYLEITELRRGNNAGSTSGGDDFGDGDIGSGGGGGGGDGGSP